MEQTQMTDAARGIKKVAAGQFLFVLGAFLTAGCIFIKTRVGLVAACAAASFVLIVIAVIFEFKGLKKASTDDSGYKTAYKMEIGALVAFAVDIVAHLIWPDLSASGSESLLYRVLSILVTYHVLNTTMQRLSASGHEEEAAKGKTVLYAVAAAYSVQALCYVAGLFVKNGGTVMGIVSDAAAVIGLIGTLIYAVYLRKVWRLL